MSNYFRGARYVLCAFAAIGLCWFSWRVYRVVRISQLARALVERGFPSGYAERLAELKFEYRDWSFVPLHVDDLSWKEIVDREMTPSWNLVHFSRWAPGKWAALKEANYTPYFAKDAKTYDSGAWYQASREAIAYFLDPRNFLDARGVFMFEALDYDAATQTRETVERVLSHTFMAGACYDGGDRTFAELVTEVGAKTGMSPVFLAGRLASEQGAGSAQAWGTIGDTLVAYGSNTTGRIGNSAVWGRRFTQTNENTRVVLECGADAYNGYFNFFNFRAYGSGLFEIKYNAWVEATCEETCQKYLGPWNTQRRAIEGGALKIKERFVDTHRHTRYLQKFSVLAEAGAYRWKQYMQNIAAPLSEARNTAAAYAAADLLDAPRRFLIPVYRDMPEQASPDPAKGRSVLSPRP